MHSEVLEWTKHQPDICFHLSMCSWFYFRDQRMFFRVRILVFHLNDRGGQDGNFGNPEVLVFVFNVGGHDLWMACWVLTLLFDPGIKTPEIGLIRKIPTLKPLYLGI